MNPKPKTPNSSLVVKHGPVSLRLHPVTIRGPKKTYHAYRIKYRLPGQPKPIQHTLAQLAKAKAKALDIAKKIAAGQTAQLTLANEEVGYYRHAAQITSRIGKSVVSVCEEYVECYLLMLGKGAPIEAVRQWNTHQIATQNIIAKPTADIVNELVETKRAKHLSARYVSDLEARLTYFATCHTRIDQLHSGDIEKWLLGLKHDKSKEPLSPRSQNNFRTAIQTLVAFAKSRKYLRRDWNELADIEPAKARIEAITTYSADELAKLLASAEEDLLPFLAIGAFAGLRTSEVQRLHWSHIRFDSKYIEVTAENARKTAQRRLVPIQPNLLEWLLPYRQKTGRVCAYDDLHRPLVAGWKRKPGLCEKAGVEWKNNALRHSFISYRVAVTQDVAKVALEAGNSPQKIFSNYRELVTEAEAQRWFNIRPASGLVANWLQKSA